MIVVGTEGRGAKAAVQAPVRGSTPAGGRVGGSCVLTQSRMVSCAITEVATGSF